MEEVKGGYSSFAKCSENAFVGGKNNTCYIEAKGEANIHLGGIGLSSFACTTSDFATIGGGNINTMSGAYCRMIPIEYKEFIESQSFKELPHTILVNESFVLVRKATWWGSGILEDTYRIGYYWFVRHEGRVLQTQECVISVFDKHPETCINKAKDALSQISFKNVSDHIDFTIFKNIY